MSSAYAVVSPESAPPAFGLAQLVILSTKIFSTCVYPTLLVGWLVELSNLLNIHNFQVVVGCSVEDGLHNQSSGGDAPGLGDSGVLLNHDQSY